jgi:glucose/arabinose dehydrogenase
VLAKPVVVVIETIWKTPWRIAASPADRPSAQISAASATDASSPAAGPVGLEGGDAEALADRGEPGGVEVENGHVVLAVERLHDRRSDLAGADYKDLHRGRRVHLERLGWRPCWYGIGMRSTLAAAAAVFMAVLAVAASAATTGQRDAALKLVKVVDGLEAPLQVTSAPGVPGLLYVVEQGGLVRIVKGGTIQPQPFLDVRALVRAGGEQGLLGLAFAPDYATSRQFVIDYTDRSGNTRVVRYRSDGTHALTASAKQLLFVKQPYANHNGGMVAYGKDGLLYVGMGDGGSGGDPENRAQNPASLLGKILRLNGTRPGAKPAIVALGVRNPWRFSFDRANGDLWIGDVGQESIEEVDHVAWRWKGLLNFGWDVYEGSAPFDTKPLGPGRLVQPVAVYSHDHGCSITGGYVYRGTAVPSAIGRYFYGDYCEGTIWSLKLVGGLARDARQEPFNVPNLTSFGEGVGGELYAVSSAGVIYRLAS